MAGNQKTNQISEHMILRQLAKRHAEDVFYTHVKNGPTQLVPAGELRVMDAVAMKRSWTHPEIIGYEVKTTRSDFMRDDKWRDYLRYCHRFSFVCPTGIIKLEELPEEIGLIYYNPEKDTITTRRKAQFREIEWPQDMLWYIIICRADKETGHPFFSSERELCQAWVDDRIDRQLLGYRVRGKIRDVTEENYRLKVENEDLKQQLQQHERIKEMLEKAGYRTYRHVLEDTVRELIEKDLPSMMRPVVEAIFEEADRLRKMLGRDKSGL